MDILFSPKTVAACMMLSISVSVAVAASTIPVPASQDGSTQNQALLTTGTAQQAFSSARPKILQIRTLIDQTAKQQSIGSGFLVSADGLALTNYHVVSDAALDPETFRLEYKEANGHFGTLELIAIDVVNDLAVVRLPAIATPYDFFQFDQIALDGKMPKGERLYSLGNPLDLGFTIVEGTYNGFIEKRFQPQIHFTGALNPGMSGGPVITADARIAGVNVAKLISGDLLSFLVPASAARALLEKAKDGTPINADVVKNAISEQLLNQQADFFSALEQEGFHTVRFGNYQAIESKAKWFSCWSNTNARNTQRERKTDVNSISCSNKGSIYLGKGMRSGDAEFSYTHIKNIKLNSFQFAGKLSEMMLPNSFMGSKKRFTPPQCRENFIVADEQASNRPAQRIIWCARAYRDFPDLYDFSLASVTQDQNDEALVIDIEFSGVDYANAIKFSKLFLNSIERLP